ncbi:MAG: GGDEF domain-containing protein, partial [Pseudomonas sp.]
RNLRGADTAGRYGGDEFCVLLPRATQAQAHEVLERVRAAVSALRFAEAEHLQVSLSIGIAGYSPALADTTAWLNAADAALYQAKHQGRNCIVLADTPPMESSVVQPV